MSQLVVGLTGGIGSGKSSAAYFFSSFGIEIIDADHLARRLVETEPIILRKIIERFGTHLLKPDGHLNRPLLRDNIFSDIQQRRWLEKLLHPLIYTQMAQQARVARSPYCIQVIPLLSARNPKGIQRILVIDARKSQQIERTLARDNISYQQVQAILHAQISRKKRLSIADDVILNEGSLDNLKQQVERLHTVYLKMSKAL